MVEGEAILHETILHEAILHDHLAVCDLKIQQPGWCHFLWVHDKDDNEYCDLQKGFAICGPELCPLRGKVISYTVDWSEWEAERAEKRTYLHLIRRPGGCPKEVVDRAMALLLKGGAE